jgi:omega-3 fatty acid desaturase (delta-15 desaturase)
VFHEIASHLPPLSPARALRCCGLAPLRLRAGRGAIATPSPPAALPRCGPAAVVAIHYDWVLRIFATLRLISTVEGEVAAGGAFDPRVPPPFGLEEIRAAIPSTAGSRTPSAS